MEKLVSIVLPIYNGEKYMRQSIDSVINQTYKNWELIIIDDCSMDNTAEIAKEYSREDKRIRYYRNDYNLKLPKGLNRGFSLAKGEYLTWTSDDNLYFPTAIERMVKLLESEHTDFVFASCDIIDEIGNKTGIIQAPKEKYKDYILCYHYVGACFLYTREVYEVIGDYNPDKFLAEDYDYWVRIFCKFDVSNIQEVLYKYRMNAESLSSTHSNEEVSSVIEGIILENMKSFGKLSDEQKFLIYLRLNDFRSIKKEKKEKNRYRKKMLYYYYKMHKMELLKVILLTPIHKVIGDKNYKNLKAKIKKDD